MGVERMQREDRAIRAQLARLAAAVTERVRAYRRGDLDRRLGGLLLAHYRRCDGRAVEAVAELVELKGVTLRNSVGAIGRAFRELCLAGNPIVVQMEIEIWRELREAEHPKGVRQCR